MKTSARALSAAVILAAVIASATAPATAQDGDDTVKVTVKYNGKGPVNEKHRLWVWLFDNPQIGPGSIPIAEMALDKNGATATFPRVAATQVWIAVAYDEGGGFTGQAPPPPGSPIAMYGMKGPDSAPQPVTPGGKGAVSISFDDTVRMQ